MLRYGLSVLLLFSTAWVEASAKPGKTQKVVYPNGRVVYEAVAQTPADKPAEKTAETKAVETEASAVQLAQVDAPAPPPEPAAESAPTPVEAQPVSALQVSPGSPPLPCDKCGDGTTPGTGECKHYNPPYIIPGSDDDCEGRRECKDKANPQMGHLGEIGGGLIKFYKDCCECRAKAYIPVIVRNQKEEYIFGKARYGEKCCEYEVCVVTKCCCIDTRNCELRPKDVKLRACRRTSNGHIDVYVLNEPGFPEQWVLYLDIPESDFRSKFPHCPVPRA
ncbi:MAG TPA: hypothetical protein VM452_16380 [Caulifigura sp.]|jgi:hypothetical protein|nr:hypothetical protein [Caulifigura sp.]